MFHFWVAACAVGTVVLLGLMVYLRQEDENEKFPVVYNVANFLDEPALRQIEGLVRAKGEAFPISIAVVNANQAQVGVGDGGFDALSGRLYKVRRSASGWEIEAIESWKNEEEAGAGSD